MGKKEMEGDSIQRRAQAKAARDAGLKPSEVGATLGASKQLKSSKEEDDSHQDKMDLKSEGKPGPGTDGKPRPGSREIDPKREEGWG